MKHTQIAMDWPPCCQSSPCRRDGNLLTLLVTNSSGGPRTATMCTSFDIVFPNQMPLTHCGAPFAGLQPLVVDLNKIDWRRSHRQSVPVSLQTCCVSKHCSARVPTDIAGVDNQLHQLDHSHFHCYFCTTIRENQGQHFQPKF